MCNSGGGFGPGGDLLLSIFSFCDWICSHFSLSTIYPKSQVENIVDLDDDETAGKEEKMVKLL